MKITFDVYGHSVNPAVYSAFSALAMHRLEGNEFSKNRPKTSMRLNIDNWNTLTFKPEILSSPKGWKMGNKIRLEHRQAVVFSGVKATGCHTILNLKEDGQLWPRQWKSDMAKTMAAFDLIKNFLNELAEDPAKVVSQNSTHCALCGRKFTDPDSMARGIGPECRKLFDFFVNHMSGGKVEQGDHHNESIDSN